MFKKSVLAAAIGMALSSGSAYALTQTDFLFGQYNVSGCSNIEGYESTAPVGYDILCKHTNVGPGNIAEGSTDVVVGGQIFSLQTTANAAQTTANAAQTTANAAQTTANAAQTTASTAQTTANTAQTTANAAIAGVSTAQSIANTARTVANAALTNAATAQSDVDAVESGLTAEATARIAGDAATLTSANSYTDTTVASEATA
ncbi:MAG: hypothetical protein BWK73_34550, partial [Thiothrix lacustris]